MACPFAGHSFYSSPLISTPVTDTDAETAAAADASHLERKGLTSSASESPHASTDEKCKQNVARNDKSNPQLASNNELADALNSLSLDGAPLSKEKTSGSKKPLYYPDYLKLDKLLSCQQPVSDLHGDPVHDELLFITVHQTYELWFKQLIAELNSVLEILAKLNIGEKSISLALHRLTRIREILKLLNEQIRVLETMTPQEFLDFRDYLFPASGFQSWQFRLIEMKIGVRPDQRINSRWIRNVSEEHQSLLRRVQNEPSLFDYVERWLRNIPFREFRGYNFQNSYEGAVKVMFDAERKNIDDAHLEPDEQLVAHRELERTYRNFESVFIREVHDSLIASQRRRLGFRATSASLMIMLYQDEPMLQLPARLLHMLVDVDEGLNQWRYRHSQMVHRMIGVKMGTGGTLGHNYLKQTIDSHKVFADIANLSTLLIPRRLLPDLPCELRDQMKYFHSVEMYDRTMFEIGGGGDEIDWSFC